MKRQLFSKLIGLAMILTLGFSAAADDHHSKDGDHGSKKHDDGSGTPVLWQDPGDISSRDLFYGPGGEAMQPDLSHITFIKEETEGYSKKYRVSDGAGHIWVAKLNVEAQPETAATRLVWAVGYKTEITYLVPEVNIEGKGTYHNVRFEARPEGIKRLDNWKWKDNPFFTSKELQGLKVIMALIDNWDMKDTNNKILRVKQPGADEYDYIISDLGATFGKTGGVIGRSRNEPEDYAKVKFIKGVKYDYVQFNYNGKHAELFRDIKVDQAHWIGELLSRLSDKQLEDAFRAANYSPEDVHLLAQTVRNRITELMTLPQSQSE